MKKITTFLLVLSTLLVALGCSKKDYSVRFVNNYKELMYNVVVGNAKFGDVDTGKTTNYLFLSTKSFLISGTSVSGVQLSSSQAVSGKGKHKWTVTLNADGSTGLTEDPL